MWCHYWHFAHLILVRDCLNKAAVSNHHLPIVLSPRLIKHFEKLVFRHIKDNIPASLDPHSCMHSDTTVIKRITDNNESSCQEETYNLKEQCSENNLLLNINKIKELSVDFREKVAKYIPCPQLGMLLVGGTITKRQNCLFFFTFINS